MERYDMKIVRKAMMDGLRFYSQLCDKPSTAYPFRAIVETAEGTCRLTRKRFVRLVMSTGNNKREAEFLAFAAHRAGISYRECLQRIMLPAIRYADEQMKNMNGAVVKAVIGSDEVE